MEVSGQIHARPLYFQGKSPYYRLDRRLDGPQSRSGGGGEKFQIPARIRTPDQLYIDILNKQAEVAD
jgi:hypothetical protein